MSVDFRPLQADQFESFAAFDGRAFGSEWKPDDLERTRRTLSFDRFIAGWDGDSIVAGAGAYDKRLTLPGGASVRASGVTWVAVAPTHRRQGLLAEMMRRLDAAAAANDEPVLILTASEGGIYERFGFGIATRNRIISIDRRFTGLRPEFQPPSGSVRLVFRREPDLNEMLRERWERYRLTQPGEISRSFEWFDANVGRGENVTVALHDDGYAVWKITQRWNDGHPAHELSLDDFCAATAEAHAALWHTILSVDLVGPITSYTGVALDDPLPYLLTDQRSLRTVGVNDFVWVAVRDPVAAFGARSYRTDDRFVVETPDAVFSVSPDGCRNADAAPDLRCTAAALGSLLLGGTSATELARGRRLWADPGVLSRADAFFGSNPLPHCRTPF